MFCVSSLIKILTKGIGLIVWAISVLRSNDGSAGYGNCYHRPGFTPPLYWDLGASGFQTCETAPYYRLQPSQQPPTTFTTSNLVLVVRWLQQGTAAFYCGVRSYRVTVVPWCRGAVVPWYQPNITTNHSHYHSLTLSLSLHCLESQTWMGSAGGEEGEGGVSNTHF